MGNLIFKDNMLVESSHKLGEIEQRLILLAILKARSHCNIIEQLRGQTLVICADDYIQTFNVDRTTAYRVLKKAVVSLFRAEWGYKFINEKGSVQVAYRRFIQSADYIDDEAIVHFKFADDTIPMLVELGNRFTIYEIEQVANLSSSYAMRLYEFFMQYFDKKTGKGWLDISLEDLRFRLGLLPNEYERMDNFKRKVLDYSVNEINKNTDLSVSYEQKKRGRVIVGFRFDFKRKATAKKAKTDENQDPDMPDMFDGLTDKEREIVAQKLAYADSKGIIDPLHRHNLIDQGLERYREAERVERERKEREEANRRTQETLEKAKRLAEKEQEERERAEYKKRQNTMIATFESLTQDEQELVLDEVAKHFENNIIAKLFKKAREEGIAHKTPQFMGKFLELFEI